MFSEILSSVKMPPKDNKKKEIQWATCDISKNSLKVTMEQDKSMIASVELSCNLFKNYRFTVDADLNSVQFQFPLQYLIDALNLYGASNLTGVHVCYPGPENSLSLLLTETEVLTDCKIRTRDIGDDNMVSDFRFNENGPPDVKLILKSTVLHEALNELEWMENSVRLTVRAAIEQRYCGRLSFSVDGDAGNLTVTLNDKEETFTSFKANTNHSYIYKLSHLMRVSKALSHTSDSCIRINDRGVLSIQVVIKSETKLNTFAEFHMLPTELTEEEVQNVFASNDDDEDMQENQNEEQAEDADDSML
ncbi:cell cycle checkpoint protein RAD17, partial [Acrasis kona]